MDIQQMVDLTYDKVDEIDKKINRVISTTRSNISNADVTSIKSAISDASTKLDTIDNKVDEIQTDTAQLNSKIETLETNSNLANTNLTEISTKLETINSSISDTTQIDNINSNLTELSTEIDTMNSNMSTLSDSLSQINSQTEKLTTINNNITTINSNTATTNNNVNIIKSDVEKIKNEIPNKSFSYEVTQKLDEILKVVRQNSDEEVFSQDPYKLDMEYTDRLEQDRNSTNYDSIEFEGDFDIKGWFCSIAADCEDTSFSFDLEISYTLENPVSDIFKFLIAGNFADQFVDIETGTKTLNITKQNLALKTNRLTFMINTYNLITVHHIKLKVYANNVVILPKRKKYKVRNAYNKMVISKIENNNGYHLILDKTNALAPSMLNQNFVLGAENILDYDYGLDLSTYINKKYSLEPYVMKIDFAQRYTYNFANGLYSGGDKVNPCHTCNLGYFTTDYYEYGTTVKSYGIDDLFAYSHFSKHSGETQNRIYFHQKEVCDSILVEDLSAFDAINKTAYIFTTLKGYNYFYINNNCNLQIGYGKNITAYYDKEDPLKINVYMNDNGYCIKKVLQINSNKTSVSLTSQKIIGSYDAYFETCSNVYLIEKDKNLYMFKN